MFVVIKSRFERLRVATAKCVDADSVMSIATQFPNFVEPNYRDRERVPHLHAPQQLGDT
jgi:hypothetical protein